MLWTKAAAIGVVSVRSGVKAISGTTVGREAVHRIAAGSLGKAVYGAAAVNHVSKLLRSNAVTATIATIATSTPEFYRGVFDRSSFGYDLRLHFPRRNRLKWKSQAS